MKVRKFLSILGVVLGIFSSKVAVAISSCDELPRAGQVSKVLYFQDGTEVKFVAKLKIQKVPFFNELIISHSLEQPRAYINKKEVLFNDRAMEQFVKALGYEAMGFRDVSPLGGLFKLRKYLDFRGNEFVLSKGYGDQEVMARYGVTKLFHEKCSPTYF